MAFPRSTLQEEQGNAKDTEDHPMTGAKVLGDFDRTALAASAEVDQTIVVGDFLPIVTWDSSQFFTFGRRCLELFRSIEQSQIQVYIPATSPQSHEK